MWSASYLAVLGLCTAVSWYTLRRDTEPHWRTMPWYLSFVSMKESTGFILSFHGIGTNLLYDLSMPVDFAVLGYFMARLSAPYGRFRPTLAVLAGVPSLALAVEALSTGAVVYTDILFASLMLASAIVYLRDLQLDFSVGRMTRTPGFWWVCGVAYFHAGTLFAELLNGALVDMDTYTHGHAASFHVFIVSNFMYYMLWMIAFRLRQRHQISSGPSR